MQASRPVKCRYCNGAGVIVGGYAVGGYDSDADIAMKIEAGVLKRQPDSKCGVCEGQGQCVFNYETHRFEPHKKKTKD